MEGRARKPLSERGWSESLEDSTLRKSDNNNRAEGRVYFNMFAREWCSPIEAASGVYPIAFLKKVIDEHGSSSSRISGYEETVNSNPTNIQAWLQFVNSVNKEEFEFRFVLYLRALHFNPNSYKLWMRLYRELERHFAQLSSQYGERDLDIIEAVYRKGSTHLYRMPKIRLLYPKFLFKVRHQITRTRLEYNDILRSLPITQHHLVWPEYIEFAKLAQCPTLGVAVYSRAVQLMPEYREDFVEYLMANGMWSRAVKLLTQLCLDQDFLPGKTSRLKSKQELWLKLCTVVTEHPECVSLTEGERLIRLAVSRASVSAATLWCALAAYYAAMSSSVDSCIAIYEEALGKVATKKDFEQIHNSYTAYLEALVKKLCSQEHDGRVGGPLTEPAEKKALVDYLIDKLDVVIARKSDLLSLMKIHAQPNDVDLWLERVNAEMDYDRCVEIFEEAISSVDPYAKDCKAYESLWIEFAAFYEANGQVDMGREVLTKARRATIKYIDQLVAIWCESVEYELRQDKNDAALHLARLSISGTELELENFYRIGRNSFVDCSGAIQKVSEPSVRHLLRTSVRLWALVFDLECSLGTGTTLATTFEEMLRHKTVTVDQVYIYAKRLQAENRFERSFQVYESAIDLFCWPHCRPLWLHFLNEITERYGSRYLLRVRALFDKVMLDIPANEALRFCYLYAKYEIDHGLVSNALKILREAVNKVTLPEKYKVYLILINRSAMHLGLTSTREIYEEALQSVADEDLVRIGIRFALMEVALLEIERARAIFEHICQFSTASTDAIWEEWKSFEVKHGTEQTYASMLRKKKAVSCGFTELAEQEEG